MDNNFWNSYFGKISQIFSYGKYTIKINIFLFFFFLTWRNNILLIIRAVYGTPDIIFKSRKIGDLLFPQVYRKQIQRNILIFIVYFPYKKIWQKNLINFPEIWIQKLLRIERHPNIMPYYQGGLLNTWHDFQFSQNRQYIVSAGFSKTNSKKYTGFYCIFYNEKIS